MAFFIRPVSGAGIGTPGVSFAGFAAIGLTILIWSSWIITAKMGVELSLTSFDLAALRYGCASIFLGYFAYQYRSVIFLTKPGHLICICLGAGLPFLFLATSGLKFTPASHAGILIPGSLPLFVTVLTALRAGVYPSAARLIGVAGIMVGIAILIIPELLASNSPTMFFGHLLYLAAGLSWSIYTVAVNESAIPPLAATGLFSVVSCVLLLVLYVFGAADTNLATIILTQDVSSYLLIVVVQGVFVGTLSAFCFTYAVMTLGASMATALSSLTPLMVVLLSVLFLGETINAVILIAMVIVCFGVAVMSCNGLFRFSVIPPVFFRMRSK